MSDVDDMLREEGEETSPASPADNKTQGDDGSNPQGAPQPSPEEVEFNSLKGPTQDRIRKILRDKKDLEKKLEQKQYIVPPPPPPGYGNQPPPEVADAVNKLVGVGMADQKYVDRKMNESLNQLRYGMELDRLKTKYNGSDGRPEFNQEEYEDYVQRHPEYQRYLIEDVYEKMYKPELEDWAISKTGKPTYSKTLKPTKTTLKEETFTPEMIEQRLKEPDGRQWYQANIDKINATLGKMG